MNKLIGILILITLTACTQRSSPCDVNRPLAVTINRGAFCCTEAITERMFKGCKNRLGGAYAGYLLIGDEATTISTSLTDIEEISKDNPGN